MTPEGSPPHLCIGVGASPKDDHCSMKAKELNKKTKAELQKVLQQNRARLRTLRFDLASGKVKNVREIRQLKKDIARILTIINAKWKEQNKK